MFVPIVTILTGHQCCNSKIRSPNVGDMTTKTSGNTPGTHKIWNLLITVMPWNHWDPPRMCYGLVMAKNGFFTWGSPPETQCLSEIEGARFQIAQWLVEFSPHMLQLSQNEIRKKEHKTKLDYVQINLVRKILSLFKSVKKFKHLYFLNRQFKFRIPTGETSRGSNVHTHHLQP